MVDAKRATGGRHPVVLFLYTLITSSISLPILWIILTDSSSATTKFNRFTRIILGVRLISHTLIGVPFIALTSIILTVTLILGLPIVTGRSLINADIYHRNLSTHPV